MYTETFQVTNNSTIGNSDTNLKSCKLLDFDSKNGFCTSEFILQIERENNIIVANIKAKYFSNNIEVYVSEVFCSNYAYKSSNSVFASSSLFKDTALLGCILSVENNNKLILNILNSGTQTTTNISTQYVSGNVFPHPVDYQRVGTYFNNYDNINIPFKDGASNTFLGCGQLFVYFNVISYDNMFRNGLYKLGSSSSVNQFLYPSLNKITNDNNLYEVDNRYLVQDNTARLIDAELPNIKGRVFLVAADNTNGGGYRSIRYQLGGDGAFDNPDLPGSNPYSNNDRAFFDASRSNPIYKDLATTVKPKSTQVQYYIKLF